MQDLSLPLSIEFKQITHLPPSDDFIESIDPKYDLSYVVAAKSTTQTVEIRVDTIEDGEVVFTLNTMGRIGIKENRLFYNPTHLVHVDTVCPSAENDKHVWETKSKSGNFHMKICAVCGRCESTPI